MYSILHIVALLGLLLVPFAGPAPQNGAAATDVQQTFQWTEGPHLTISEFWNAPARAGCDYARNPWPRAQLAAARAYALAARQVLRDAWNISGWIGANRSTTGQARILGTETDCFGGHVDYPAHFHVLYQWTDASGWRHVNSHFYPDATGKITDFFVIPDQCRPGNGSYHPKPGDWVDVLDETCTPIWQQRFTSSGSVELRRSASAPVYALRVTGINGDLANAEVWQDNNRIAKIEVDAYDPVGYRMVARISDYSRLRMTTETWWGDPGRPINRAVQTTPIPLPSSMKYRVYLPNLRNSK